MKKLNNLFTLLSALLLLGACEKDGDTYFLSSPEENELIASAIIKYTSARRNRG